MSHSMSLPASWGADWTGKITLILDCGHSYESRVLSSGNAVREIEYLIQPEETIQQVWMYSTRLFWYQLYQGLFMWHAYIMLETQNWYWSIEKNTKGIVIQRSKNPDFIKYLVEGHERKPPITLRQHAVGSQTVSIRHVFDWAASQRGIVYNAYLWMTNCQGFAGRLFDFCRQ